MEAWVNPRGAAFTRIIFAQPSTSNFAALCTGSSNQIYFYVVVNGVTHSIATTNTMPQNQWTHVAARWTSGTNTPEVFFNGVLQAGASGGTSSTGTSGMLTLGTRPGGAQYFNGAVDEVRIWSVARTQCQIQGNYQRMLTGPEPNLLLNYSCNQGTGGGNNAGVTSLPDNSGNANNGTLSNFALTGTNSNWITSNAGITSSGSQAGGVSISQSTAVCSGASYTFPDGSTQSNITTTVSHVSTFPGPGGCDTLITTTVSANPTYNQSDSATVCSGGSYTFHDGTSQSNITSPMIHTSLLQTQQGCDSIIITFLDVASPASTNETAAVCSGDSYTFPDGSTQTNITSQVVYTSNLQGSGGCDSLVITTVNVNQDYQITEVVDFCPYNDYTFPDGTVMTNITQDAIYTSYLTTQAGCDSIIITNIVVVPIDTSVYINSGTLSSNTTLPTVTYQWLDCNNGFAPIAGATNSTFTPASSGSYAVALSMWFCTDTSLCHNVTVVGSEVPQPAASLQVYPNPSNGKIWVKSSVWIDGKVEVMDLRGVLLKTVSCQSDEVMLDCSDLSKGVYLLRISAAEGIKVERFVIE